MAKGFVAGTDFLSFEPFGEITRRCKKCGRPMECREWMGPTHLLPAAFLSDVIDECARCRSRKSPHGASAIEDKR